MKLKSSRVMPLGLTLAAALLTPTLGSAAVLLAGFHTFPSTSADEAFAGFTGSITTGTTGNGGDRDNFYGPDSSALGGYALLNPTPAIGGDGRITNAASASITVTNNTATDYPLVSLLFDGTATASANPVTYNIAWETSDGQVGSESVGTSTVDGINYVDFLVDLSGFFLNAGESITFSWAGSTAGARLDNIALVAVPEPAGVMAIGCLLGSGLLLRSRRRKAASC
jgi:hypothetical protein